MSENTIKFEKGEYNIGAISIAEIKVQPISFRKFAEVIEPEIFRHEDSRERNKAMTRAQMKARCIAVGDDGKMYQVDDAAISGLPIKKSVDLKIILNSDGAEPGEILNDANGVDAPILVRLGTPLKNNKGILASELEFQARKYSDIEDVLACPYLYSQTVALIEKCARTVDKNDSLPSWAVDGITLEDGLKIAEILPRFFG